MIIPIHISQESIDASRLPSVRAGMPSCRVCQIALELRRIGIEAAVYPAFIIDPTTFWRIAFLFPDARRFVARYDDGSVETVPCTVHLEVQS